MDQFIRFAVKGSPAITDKFRLLIMILHVSACFTTVNQDGRCTVSNAAPYLMPVSMSLGAMYLRNSLAEARLHTLGQALNSLPYRIAATNAVFPAIMFLYLYLMKYGRYIASD